MLEQVASKKRSGKKWFVKADQTKAKNKFLLREEGGGKAQIEDDPDDNLPKEVSNSYITSFFPS